MKAKVLQKIKFPDYGWISHNVAGPHNGRFLVEIRGHSGMSSWCGALMTFPENAIDFEVVNDIRNIYYLNPGVYNIQEAQDKRGRRLVRFYNTDDDAQLILFDADGFLVQEASSIGVVALAECEGSSRTGRNGNRWTLVIAKPGDIVAIEPYYAYNDPIYYKVYEDRVEDLGDSTAVLAPDEW